MRLSLFSLLALMFCENALAGWQSNGYYINDSYYVDDGSRFVISLRGGLSLANAKMKNEMGSLEADYYASADGDVISEVAFQSIGGDIYHPEEKGYTYVGAGNVASLPVKKDFSKMAFTAGGSIGFTVPYHPQWRLEAGFDHVSETDYNETPFLEGDLTLSSDVSAHVFSSGVTSTVTTDIISVMAFYDFYEGKQKQLNQFIPYIGFGIGYASSKTTLKLVDIYGDLSKDSDLVNYGTLTDGVIQFADPSNNDAPTSSNVAFLGSLGTSYGISKYTFIDFNFRLMYVPKINWQLVNGASHRDWFAAEDMFYTNFTVGLRFEF